jgi:hypothetical protein
LLLPAILAQNAKPKEERIPMKLRKFLLASLAISVTSANAEDSGSISGTVYGPYDEQVAYAPIQATNLDTELNVRADSGRDGKFELQGLPEGSYKLQVNMPCCAYGRFASDAIAVAGKVEFDIQLEEGGSFNTVGDDPGIIAAAIKDRQVIPDLPVPRTPDGKPDLSGLWLEGDDPFPERPDAKPWAREKLDERIANNFRYHPHNQCLPGDPPIPGGAAPFMAKFVHKDELLVVLFEDYPGFRQVFLDGREHPEWPNPSWMGHSVGHWEGDELVIDTIGFNDRGWMGGYPRSEQLHITERYRRTEYGRMEMTLTVEDPEVFNAPWSQFIVFDLAPQEELIEFVCENNKWAETDTPQPASD